MREGVRKGERETGGKEYQNEMDPIRLHVHLSQTSWENSATCKMKLMHHRDYEPGEWQHRTTYHQDIAREGEGARKRGREREGEGGGGGGGRGRGRERERERMLSVT